MQLLRSSRIKWSSRRSVELVADSAVDLLIVFPRTVFFASVCFLSYWLFMRHLPSQHLRRVSPVYMCRTETNIRQRILCVQLYIWWKHNVYIHDTCIMWVFLLENCYHNQNTQAITKYDISSKLKIWQKFSITIKIQRRLNTFCEFFEQMTLSRVKQFT